MFYQSYPIRRVTPLPSTYRVGVQDCPLCCTSGMAQRIVSKFGVYVLRDQVPFMQVMSEAGKFVHTRAPVSVPQHSWTHRADNCPEFFGAEMTDSVPQRTRGWCVIRDALCGSHTIYKSPRWSSGYIYTWWVTVRRIPFPYLGNGRTH